MEYGGTVVRVVRVAVRNPFAIVLVSVGAAVSSLPLFAGVMFAGVWGGIVGLWTSSLLLGVVGVGGARIARIVLEREVSLGTSYFWEGIREGPTMAAAVGLGTFAVAAVALALAVNPLTGIPGLSVAMIGVYALLGWFVLAVFALTYWASAGPPTGVRASFAAGGRLVLERPKAAAWLVAQALGWTLLAVPLVIAPVVVLPGLVLFIGTALAMDAAERDEEDEEGSERDDGPAERGDGEVASGRGEDGPVERDDAGPA